MTVGLFGFYRHGNFGDDLMALLFSKVLRDSGYRVISASCRPALAVECGIDAVESIDSLVDEADAIVYGGGGILVPHTMTADSEYSKYRGEIAHLVRRVEEAGKPLAAYSIGGTGAAHDSLPEPVRALIQSEALSSCTLRLKGDRTHFQGDAQPPPVYPDVVLKTSALFPCRAPERRGERTRFVIGVNVGLRAVDHRLRRILRPIRGVFPRTKIMFFDTFTPDSAVRTEEMRSALASRNVRYTSVQGHLARISQVDMLFTHKLHIGVAALSYGVPALSWAGAAKARRFLTDIGAGGAVVDARRRQALLFLLKMMGAGGKCPESCKPDIGRLSELRIRSGGHLAEMTRWLDLMKA